VAGWFVVWYLSSRCRRNNCRRRTPHATLALDIFKQLIEINTTDSVGNVTTAAEAMAQRFRDAGFPESDIHVLGHE